MVSLSPKCSESEKAVSEEAREIVGEADSLSETEALQANKSSIAKMVNKHITEIIMKIGCS